METTQQIDNNLFSVSEPYMNDRQLAYFKNKLIMQKMELMEKVNLKKGKLKLLGESQADIIDKSNTLAQVEQDIRVYQRETQLIRQIDDALLRIEDGSFGYCQITGMEIGLRRLDIMPFTTMSIQALEQIESGNPPHVHI